MPLLQHPIVSVAIMLVVCIVGLIVGARFVTWRRQYDKTVLQQAERLVKRAGQSSVMAHQDTSPLVALAHISDALASADLAQRLVKSNDLTKLTGVHLPAMVELLEKQRDHILQHSHARCPQLAPSGLHAPASGWL